MCRDQTIWVPDLPQLLRQLTLCQNPNALTQRLTRDVPGACPLMSVILGRDVPKISSRAFPESTGDSAVIAGWILRLMTSVSPINTATSASLD
jgi:hypothetical protein